MPMDFPDMKSLIAEAELTGFRKPLDGEAEAAYRELLADHVAPIDFIESEEVRNGVGWDQFSIEQNREMVLRRRW